MRDDMLAAAMASFGNIGSPSSPWSRTAAPSAVTAAALLWFAGCRPPSIDGFDHAGSCARLMEPPYSDVGGSSVVAVCEDGFSVEALCGATDVVPTSREAVEALCAACDEQTCGMCSLNEPIVCPNGDTRMAVYCSNGCG